MVKKTECNNVELNGSLTTKIKKRAYHLPIVTKKSLEGLIQEVKPGWINSVHNTAQNYPPGNTISPEKETTNLGETGFFIEITGIVLCALLLAITSLLIGLFLFSGALTGILGVLTIIFVCICVIFIIGFILCLIAILQKRKINSHPGYSWAGIAIMAILLFILLINYLQTH
ncbi:MAG: hypothetical protein ACLQQ4_12490 [Bacteroidia bacterium]